MTLRPGIDMAEATRLTRAGRLDEAMAVLRGARPAPPEPAAAEPVAGAAIDMEPPTYRTGAWSVAFEGVAKDPPRPATGPRAPLREVLGRLRTMRTPGGATPDVPVPLGARFESRRHDGPAGRLDYRLYVPAAHPGPLPLLIMLHGCTQSPEDFAAGTAMNAVAEEMGILVAYPEQTRGANAQLCWNWFDPASQGRSGEAALLAAIVRDVVRDEGADPARVYAAGLSAGGAAAAILGAAYPDVFAAVGVHSGLAAGAARDVPSAFAAMRQGGAGGAPGRTMPTIVLHGDRDATVAPANGDAVAAQARGGARLRARVTTGRSDGGMGFTRTVHADAAGRAMVEHWVLHGAGHAWSGGSPTGTYVEPRGPDASRAVASFLLGHRLA